MKRRKKLSSLLLTLILALSISMTTSLAYMFSRTETVTNEFIPASVSCQVSETFRNNEKTSVRVRNTGNAEAYLRLRLASHWVSEGGEILPQPSELPAVAYDSSTWLYDAAEKTYYCKAPVAPGALTPELLTTPMVLTERDFGSQTGRQVVEIFAEAIQSRPAEAVTGSWQVTLDSGTPPSIASKP